MRPCSSAKMSDYSEYAVAPATASFDREIRANAQVSRWARLDKGGSIPCRRLPSN